MTVVSDAPPREPVEPTDPRSGLALRLVFGVVTALGALFLVWTRSDLWLDEALSVNIARLPLGAFAHRRIRQKLNDQIAELDAWETLGKNTDFSR